MADQKLKTLWVEFETKGFENVRKAVSTLTSQLAGVVERITSTGTAGNTALGGLSKQFTDVGRYASEASSRIIHGLEPVAGAADAVNKDVSQIGGTIARAAAGVVAAGQEMTAALGQVRQRVQELRPQPLSLPLLLQGIDQAKKQLAELKAPDVPVQVKALGLADVEKQLQAIKPQVQHVPFLAEGLDQVLDQVQKELASIKAPRVLVPVEAQGLDKVKQELAAVSSVPIAGSGLSAIEKDLEAFRGRLDSLRGQSVTIPVQTGAEVETVRLDGLQQSVALVGKQSQELLGSVTSLVKGLTEEGKFADYASVRMASLDAAKQHLSQTQLANARIALGMSEALDKEGEAANKTGKTMGDAATMVSKFGDAVRDATERAGRPIAAVGGQASAIAAQFGVARAKESAGSTTGPAPVLVPKIQLPDVSALLTPVMEKFKTFAGAVKPLISSVIEQVKAGFGVITAGITSVTTASGNLTQQIQAGLGAITAGVAAVTASVAGFVRSGLAASALGEVMRYRFEQLALSLSGLFRPEIEAVIETVQAVTEKIRGLTATQAEHLSSWLKIAAGAVAAAAIFPTVITAIKGITAAVIALNIAVVEGLAATGIGALVPLIGAAVSVLAGLVVGTEAGQKALGKLFEAFRPVAAAVDSLVSAFSPLIDLIKPIGELIAAAFKPIATVIQTVADIVAPIISGLSAIITPVINVISALANVLGSTLAAAISVLVSPLRIVADILGTLWKLFGKLIEGVLNKLADVFNVIADAIDKARKAFEKFMQIISLGIYRPEEEDKKAKEKNRGALGAKASPFGDVSRHFEETAQRTMGLGMGKNVDEQQLEVLERIETNTEEMGRKRMVPVIVDR